MNVAANLRAELHYRAESAQITGMHDYVSIVLRHRKGGFASSDFWVAEAKAHATDAQRAEPLFAAATDRFWPEQLALYLARDMRLDEASVTALLRVHEIEESANKRAIERASTKLWVGTLLAVGAFFANQVPEELFAYMDWDFYGAYRTWVFIGLAVVLAYFLILVAVSRPLIGRGHIKSVEAELALTRSALLYVDALLAAERVRRRDDV